MDSAVSRSLNASDLVFLLLLAGALVLVAYVGRMAYHEASLTEVAKSNAAQLHQWFEQLAQVHASGNPTPLEDCVADGEKTWEQCRSALTGEQGPLKGLRNPFDSALPLMGPKCDRADLNTRGLVVLEKGIPAPPGAPPGVSYAVFEDSDKLTKDMPVRIIVCDKGAYALRVAEVKL